MFLEIPNFLSNPGWKTRTQVNMKLNIKCKKCICFCIFQGNLINLINFLPTLKGSFAVIPFHIESEDSDFGKIMIPLEPPNWKCPSCSPFMTLVPTLILSKKTHEEISVIPINTIAIFPY